MSNKAVLIIIAFLLFVGGALWVIAISVGSRPTRTAAAPSLTPAQRAEAQAAKNKACSTVSRLKGAGGFTKVEAGYSGVSHAYVDTGFYQVPIDAKESALKWVALCYIDLNKKDQLGIVVVHDGYSGKQIGTFDFASGLELD